MKLMLKAPGSMLLQLRHGGPLSNFAFKFNSRRYTQAPAHAALDMGLAKQQLEVEPAGHCSPSHPKHFEPSSIE
jgi:hypothetical protein